MSVPIKHMSTCTGTTGELLVPVILESPEETASFVFAAAAEVLAAT
jgi:hypothetical protein